MSKKKNCKFIWLISKETSEVLLPYRTFDKIGSLGGKINKKIEGHDPLTNGNLEIKNFLNNKKEEIKNLDVNTTNESIIHSYYLNLTKEELYQVKQELEIINSTKGDSKSFKEFKIRNLKENPICDNDKYCGTAKEELTKIMKEII